MDENLKRKGRGKGKRPALVYFPVRVSTEVLEFFEQYPNKSKKIREVLEQYIKQHKGQNDEKTEQEISQAE